MTALEALTREPLHGHGHLAAAAGVPAIQLCVLDTLAGRAVPPLRLPWLDGGACSDSDSDSDSDGGFALPVLPTTGPRTTAVDLVLPRLAHHAQQDVGARGAGACSSPDEEFARLGDGYGDDLFEHTVTTLAAAPTRMAMDASVATAMPAPARMPTPTPTPIRRASNRRAVTIAPGSKYAAMDTQLLAIFSDADFELSKHEWSKRLKLARLSPAQEVRAKQLRRKILSRRYADDNRKKNARQIVAVADDRARLLADNDTLRSENARLMAELASLKRTFGSR